MEEFKDRTPDFALELRAKEIYDRYLKPGAEMELNINASLRNEVESQLINPPRTLFLALQKEIRELMQTDSIPKFILSPLYLDWKGNYKTQPIF